MLSHNIKRLYAKYVHNKVYRGGDDDINKGMTLFGHLFSKHLTYSFGTGKYVKKYNLIERKKLNSEDKNNLEEIKKDTNFEEIAPYIFIFSESKSNNVTSMLFGKKNDSTVKFISLDGDLAEYDYRLLGRQPS